MSRWTLSADRPVSTLAPIPPSGFKGHEPRGLIRLGYPVLTNGGYELINFIAIEPVVRGRKGFSELEKSKLDGVNGVRTRLGDPLPVNFNRPMWETSKTDAALRVCSCSGMMPLYSNGISQPAYSTILAPALI